MRQHVLGCDDYHQHTMPYCCASTCWCRKNEDLIGVVHGMEVKRDGGALGDITFALSFKEAAEIVNQILLVLEANPDLPVLPDG